MSDQPAEGERRSTTRLRWRISAGIAVGVACIAAVAWAALSSGPAAQGSPAGRVASPSSIARSASASESTAPGAGFLQIHTELPLTSDQLPFCPTASLGNPHRLTRSGTDLVLVDVDTGTPTVIVWPYGFVARLAGDRAELVAPDGSVVAREGDLLEVGGGFALPGFHVCEIDGATYVNGQTWK